MNIQSIYNKYAKKINEFIKFSLVGVLVTIVSLVLMYVFLEFLNTPLILTYILLYGSTIFLSYYLNTRYTFKAKQDRQSMLKYYGIYLFTLALGSLCIYILRKLLPFKNWVIAFMVVPFTMFMNFILSSLIFKKNRL
jgi:putative flippase GtrA